jgi:hypothetical protein
MRLLAVMTALVLVAAGSARGTTSPGPLRLDNAGVTRSGPSSSPVMMGDESLSKTILPPAPNFAVEQLFAPAIAEDADGDGEKNPPPRSTHCPPDKDDHQANGQKGGDNQNKDNQDNDNKDKDNKDKDQHDNCGKGDDGKNP